MLDWITGKEKTTDAITDNWKQLYKDGKNGDKDYFKSVLTSSGKAMLKNILKPELCDYMNKLLDLYPDYTHTDIPLPEPGTPAKDLHLALEHNNLTKDWNPSHPVLLYHSTDDEVVPFDNYLTAASQFGDMASFYPSVMNGTHVATGMEFFLGGQRIECLRLLATGKSAGIGAIAITPPNAATSKWHDLYGRPINGEPATRGIYISGGKKMLIKP